MWRSSLDVSEAEVRRLRLELVTEELERADRFRFDKDRRAFIVARGRLRGLLAKYLRIEPQQIHLSQTEYGKPFCVNSSEDDLRFNLSYSGNLVIYAFANGRDAGVDLEQIREIPEVNGIVASIFSKLETHLYRL